MNKKELQDIIKQCKAQKREAQAALYATYKDTLYVLSLKYCKNQKDAEDIVHDAFMTIFEKIKTYQGKGSFEGWMKRITIYKAIDRYKKQKEFPEETFPKITEEDTQVRSNFIEIPLTVLLQKIQELPHQYRLVFNLFQLDNYSHKEIAKLLSISEGTSKSNYHRAKLLLKEKIMKYHQQVRNTPDNYGS